MSRRIARGSAGAPTAPVGLTAFTISPAIGTADGGTAVTLTTAERFRSGDETAVTIGGAALASPSFVDTQTITGNTPAGTVGPRTVAITGYHGSVSKPEAFLYQAGGAQSISGSVTDGVDPVSYGAVQLWNSDGSALLTTAAVDVNGDYSFSDVPNGTYHVMLHPAPGYSMGASEAGANSADPADAPSVVVSGNSPTQNFVVQAGYFHEDFSSFADHDDFIANWPYSYTFRSSQGKSQMPGRAYWYATKGATGGPCGAIFFCDNDTNPGCQGWDGSNPSAGGTNGFLISLGAGNTSTQWWFRQTRKEGRLSGDPLTDASTAPNEATDFRIARAGNRYWKWVHIGFNKPAGPGQRRLRNAFWNKGGATPGHMFEPSYENTNGDTVTNNWVSVDNNEFGTNFCGRWHSYVTHMNLTTDTAALFRWYLDGALLHSEGPANFAWAPADSGQIDSLIIGSTYNSSPEQEQFDFVQEIGLYKTRPALLDYEDLFP